jgi:hypothetical protein
VPWGAHAATAAATIPPPATAAPERNRRLERPEEDVVGSGIRVSVGMLAMLLDLVRGRK